MTPENSIAATVALLCLGLLSWVMKKLVNRLDTGNKELVATLQAMQASLVRIETSEANEAEHMRFQRDSFTALMNQMAKLFQRLDRRHGLDEIHYRDTEDTHAMMSDVHRAVVDRDTAKRRLEDIERDHRERMERKRESEP